MQKREEKRTEQSKTTPGILKYGSTPEHSLSDHDEDHSVNNASESRHHQAE